MRCQFQFRRYSCPEPPTVLASYKIRDSVVDHLFCDKHVQDLRVPASADLTPLPAALAATLAELGEETVQ